MATSNSNFLNRWFGNANQWFRDTPERALDQAYDAALKIRSLENEHFQGEKIPSESHTEYSDRTLAYFNSELKKHLKIIQTRLMVFNASRSVLGLSEQLNPASTVNGEITHNLERNGSLPDSKTTSIICEKLDYIDTVISRYHPMTPEDSVALMKAPTNQSLSLRNTVINQDLSITNAPGNNKSLNNGSSTSSSGKTIQEDLTTKPSPSVLPRSLLRTLNRVQQELRPESEFEMIQNYRKSKIKTLVSIRFVLLIILIPLLTQQLAKNFVVGPLVDRMFTNQEQTPIFLNVNMEEEAFIELQHYEQRLKFQTLIGQAPPLTPQELDEKLEEKAKELAEEYKVDGSNAIKNVFADIIAVFMFCFVLVSNRKEVEILKSFMGDLIYGLSDSAKAFIIILSTDMFVGFHSPHGWEVILESTARHFGLPENRDFNFLFIATFPVILDAVFKYWIFRYLNRSSPSAVSTYKTMNE
ncbi:proton extrusion protein PcxA [Planktothrix mougeotii]|uniref:Proton extrusion protein PxcA n=1 Tax=Planktothrix mougeotii LEGE 06226 TaxID=1828728 RepID=A0ABR9UCP4_9CYAN|nr:proton extrusion protein PcxA [Planktothrix mougeotii]MBE9144223.1 proton extrusion protein PcxA [Planktothrix mougeotii LEGE 06226]